MSILYIVSFSELQECKNKNNVIESSKIRFGAFLSIQEIIIPYDLRFWFSFRFSPFPLPPSQDFFLKTCPHQSQWRPSPLKIKPPSRKWFLEKSPKRLEAVISNCVLLIKQHWKIMTEIPQKRDFLAEDIQSFIRKVKLLEKIILLS